MKILPPLGYQEIRPLKETSRVVLPRPGLIPAFCDPLHALPISYAEYPIACHYYPIIFVSFDKEKTFGAMVVLGLKSGINLFIEKESWEPNTYVPAYVRRYPFCMAQVVVDGKIHPERLVCAERKFIGSRGEALYDADENPTPRWQATKALLLEYESDLALSNEMCAILRDYKLFEPFSIHAAFDLGETMNVKGMYRISEDKIKLLTASQLRVLLNKGIMPRIYAHLLSLNNFPRLLDRQSARADA